MLQIITYNPAYKMDSRLFLFDIETELPIRDNLGLCIPAGINEPGILCTKLDERRKFGGYYKVG